MRIDTLLISNFRGIEKAEIRNAGDTVIIAGQNGSGKSCVFDAIRLLKSVYGGYHQNEWQNWFGEFQVNPNSRAEDLKSFFNDPSRPVLIDCFFKLRDDEKAFINANAPSLLEESIWRMLLPEAFQWGGFRMAMFSAQFRERQPEVAEQVAAQLPELLQELRQETVVGHVEMQPGGKLQLSGSRLLSAVFSNFRPKDLGVIDYHGAQRHYGREAVQGINLNLEQNSQNYSQHALYNYSNKYANVKSEMAAGFVRELLAEKAGTENATAAGLTETLKELFVTFFPGKEFLGPKPTIDGRLEFPVRTGNGNLHDLDELSAGEKEILYGYLRIRSSAPKNSIILLDEPELHLNPRLIRNLPEFYRKHLGESLNNQLWLVTHSDALLREAVGKPGFNVFHMYPCGQDNGEGQLRELKASEDLDLAMADLVGDLAAYRPDGTAILFEGGGDTDFDQSIVARLFAKEVAGINLLSGSNKARVEALHDVLNRAYSKGDLPIRFFAITDRDSDNIATPKGLRRYQWDVYHIENYLLEPSFVAAAVNSVDHTRSIDTETALDGLRAAARKVVPRLLRQRMRDYVNSQMVQCIDLRFDPAAEEVVAPIAEAAQRSLERLKERSENQLTKELLSKKQEEWKSEIEEAFANGRWKSLLPGREILKMFVNDQRLAIAYDALRNLIVSKMVDAGFKPLGMKSVISEIVGASTKA
ncbi:AAA family ATPase [Rhizobium mesosinicum]|uniref:AAA family ATPase n=1 Tax=Rhizobium mesosinicum TaxID=335017 RepID=A0ABS7H0T4_9HYPH|nr:AAA family ATPase [Rhizobium mesosinicum]MBW9055482.1 AAA family ATPase [Rhizobium mesosinicum]